MEVTRLATGAALVEDIQVSHDASLYATKRMEKKYERKEKGERKGGLRIQSGPGTADLYKAHVRIA